MQAGPFPQSSFSQHNARKLQLGGLGVLCFKKKKQKKTFFSSLYMCKDFQINKHFDFSMQLHSLCLNSSELCTRLPALMPLCICFSALISMHADGKLNYEKPQSLISSRCGCQRKVRIQLKMVLGNLNLPLQESPLIILGED